MTDDRKQQIKLDYLNTCAGTVSEPLRVALDHIPLLLEEIARLSSFDGNVTTDCSNTTYNFGVTGGASPMSYRTDV